MISSGGPFTVDTVTAQIESMLNGSGGVVRLDRSSDAIGQNQIPDGFTGVLVSTSGSTGTPKTVMLSRGALTSAAQAAHDRLGGPGAWVNPLPPWYVAGLMTVVRAILAGCPHRQISPHLEDLPHPGQRSYLSLVPAQLHRGLSDPEICKILTTYDAVLIGGAALDESLHAQAVQAGVRVVTTYGMSETCGGVVYDGIPLDGVTVRFQPIDPADPIDAVDPVDPGGTGREPAEGRILLETPTLFDGYLGDQEDTAKVKIGHAFLTSDRGLLIDSRLHVLGRVDDVVQSGGVNVDLAAIQRLLERYFPHQTACFAVPDPVWGATVILASTGPDLDQIMDRLGPHIDSAARPRGIMGLDALPRTHSGKIDRETLAEKWRLDGNRA